MSDPRLADLLARIAAIQAADDPGPAPSNPDNWPNMGVAKIYTQPAPTKVGPLAIMPVAPYYNDVVETYLAAVNKSFLYSGLIKNEGPYLVLPYRTSPTNFWLVSEIGDKVTIEVSADKADNPGVRAQVTGKTVRIPATSPSIIPIQLGLGRNWIEVRQGDRIFRYMVYATRLAGIAYTVAKAIYDTSYRQWQEVRSDLLAPISSRLLEHTLPFANLIPAIRALRIMGVRGSTLARLLHSATDFGVRTLLDSMVANTSNLQDIPMYPDEIDPADDPSYLLEQRFAKDAFVWIPHRGVVRREALVKLAVNVPEMYPLVSAAVREVVVDVPHLPEEIHQFEHPDFDFVVSDLLARGCYEILVSTIADIDVSLIVCGVMFIEHQVVDRCARLGRRFFDCVDFDDPLIGFDWEDDFDPMSDAWADFPLTEGHADPLACLGIQAAGIPEESNCCWLWGPPMTALNAQLTEPTAVTDASVEWLIHYLPPDP